MVDDPYRILQVARHAEQEVIEAAYRRLARKYHPDVNPSSDATYQMQKINWANNILSDPLKRARYDRGTYIRDRYNTRAGEYRPYKETKADNRDRGSSPQAEAKRESASSTAEPTSEIQPPLARSLAFGTLFLSACYLISFLFSLEVVARSSVLITTLVVTRLVGDVVLALVAAKGWMPRRAGAIRVLFLLLLASFPITAWIPCYLAGKAVARRVMENSHRRHPISGQVPTPSPSKSRWPLYIYGIASTLLSIAIFGEIFRSPLSRTDPAFSEYRDPEVGISFKYPSFLTLKANTTKDRMPNGALFTFSTIFSESSDPVVVLGIRIIEDASRNEMFPNLYPPSDEVLHTLLMGNLVEFEFPDTEPNNPPLLDIVNEASITKISGYPAAEYALTLDDTVVGDAYMRGALIITDRRDVSIFILGSIETNAPGSVDNEYIDEIWDYLAHSIRLDF